MAVRIILSDLGNVVLDYDFTETLKKLSAASAVRVEPVSIYGELFVKNGEPWRRFLRGHIGDEEMYLLCRDLFKLTVGYAEFREIISNIWKPNSTVFDLWMKLFGRGYVLALLSNLDRINRDFILRYYKLPPFEICVYSCDTGHIKPEPEIFETALGKLVFFLNAKPDEIVFVDDIEANVEAARKFGIHAIHYTGNNEKLCVDLRTLGVSVD